MTQPPEHADDGPQAPQIYLITPPQLELSSFPNSLSAIMDVVEIACVRLALATADEDEVSRAADLLRETCHARDVPLILDTHVRLVNPRDGWPNPAAPIVAEGGLTLDTVEAFAPFADFMAIGPEIWPSDDPLKALKALTAPMR